MGRFVESMGFVAACAACLGLAVIGVGCGGEGTVDSRGTRVEGTEPGDCEDGADNDADGLFDCADPSCEASPLCDGGAGGNSGTGGVGGSVLCADVDCDDQNQCTEDACNPMDGACGYTNAIDGLSCDFGGLPGVCNAGACEDAMLCAAVDCDDQNQCTEDACDPMDGTCGYTNATDGTACGFGSLPGVCTAGVCEDAMLCADVDCDDSDQCTQDVCNPMDGQCLYANATDGTACDFGVLPGVCNAGACEDAMLCATVDCDDGNQCTEDACDPMDGQCGYANATDGTSCDFGGLPGVCTAGVCEDAQFCNKSALCKTCPVERLCDSDTDCLTGGTCIESGCEDLAGAPIKQCAYAVGGACTTTLDCDSGSECIALPGESERCVRTAPGCSEQSHCAEGFDCEDGACVDRRVPCEYDSDCPKNYLCQGAANDGQQCVRVHQPCEGENDCFGIAPRCADVDGDGNNECAGVPDPYVPGDACLNMDCTSADAPVCEISGVGVATVCGDYGLCRDNSDCDMDGGFVCVLLGLEGRKECARAGGCSSSTECPPQQVCGSPRVGEEPPSCQAGKKEEL